jgi:predicted enzyme related to lactoylglutathione lyase
LATEHIDQSVEQVKAAGGEIVMGPMDVMGQVQLAILRDPTGAFLALNQPGTHRGFQIANEPGAFTWAELETRDIPRAKQFYLEAFDWGEETTPSIRSGSCMARASVAPCPCHPWYQQRYPLSGWSISRWRTLTTPWRRSSNWVDRC